MLGAFENTASLMATLYWGGLLVGRLISSFLNKISPKIQLTMTTISAAILILAAILTRNPWLLVVVGLFHSIMWGAIFTMAIDKLGKYSSAASGVLMIGVLGGAIIPLFQGIIADVMGGQWNMTWFLVIGGELYLLYYALLGSKIKTSAIDV
jgi:MFS transporter, FHS family, L-fucose permease